MATKIGLLRGINVGRAKRVAMADLRAVVEGLGYEDVRTLLNSGNVVFRSCDDNEVSAARIEEVVASKLGVTSRVTVISEAELAAAIAENPLGEVATDPSRLLVTVLNRTGDRARLAPLQSRRWSPDALALGTRVAYLWCPNGVLASDLGAAASKALGDAGTSRNWSTMLKLQALAASLPSEGGRRPPSP